MKTLISKIKKVRPAVLIGMLALFIAVGGTATAASGLINGKKIKKGTVTSKQIKNKTLTSSKFAQSTLDALKGPQGPRGEKGAKGDKGNPGAKGNTGIPGVAGPEVVTTFSIDNSENIAANDNEDVVAYNNMDSGKYLFIAKVRMVSNVADSELSCTLETNNGGGGDQADWTSPGNVTRNTVPLMLSTTANITQAVINCEPGTSAGFFDVNAIAIPIG